MKEAVEKIVKAIVGDADAVEVYDAEPVETAPADPAEPQPAPSAQKRPEGRTRPGQRPADGFGKDGFSTQVLYEENRFVNDSLNALVDRYFSRSEAS